MKRSSLVLLSLILLLGLVFRTYRLGNIPNGFFFDEATISYQAYSVLKTGFDTWGKPYPIFSFKDYGEHILPLGVYLQIPAILLGGLNVFWARMPGAVVGTITIFLIYQLAKTLFGKKVAFLSSFIAVLNPLLIGWNRFVFEGNVGTMFFCLGVLFSIHALEKKSHLWKAILFLGLSMVTYHVFLVLTPLYFLVYFILYPKDELLKKQIFASVLLFIFFMSWGFGSIVSGAGRQRFKQASNLVTEQNIDVLNHHIGYCQSVNLGPVCRLVMNKYELQFDKYLYNYLSHFSPQFLAFDGSFLRQNVLPSSIGLLGIVPYIGLVVGVALLVGRWKEKKFLLILSYLAIYPMANSFTGTGEISRVAFAAPVLILISGYGVSMLSKIRYSKIVIYFCLLFSFVSFLVRYFTIFPVVNAYNTDYGYDVVFQFINSHWSKYQRFLISRNYSGSVPYISALFFLPVDPNSFRDGRIDRYKGPLDFYVTTRIDKMYFYQRLSEFKILKTDFIIATPEELQAGVKPKFRIIDPTGRVLLIGIEGSDYEVK